MPPPPSRLVSEVLNDRPGGGPGTASSVACKRGCAALKLEPGSDISRDDQLNNGTRMISGVGGSWVVGLGRGSWVVGRGS